MLNNLKTFLFQNLGPKQTIIKNTFWLAAAFSGRILRLLIILYAARVLGATEYGLFSYIIALLAVLSVFNDMGISELLTRDIAINKDRQSAYFATSFWIKIILIAISSIFILLIAPYITKIDAAKPLIHLAILLMVFDSTRELILSYLRGIEKMELEAAIVIVLNGSIALFGFFILLWQPSAKNLLYVYITSSTLALMVSIIIAKKILGGIFHGFQKKLAAEILKNSWPIAVSIAFGAIFSLDIIMLSWWRSQTEVGVYAASQKIIQALFILPTLLATAVFPTLSSMIKSGRKQEEVSIKEKSMATMFLFMLPAIVGGIILSGPILQFVYGQQYTAGAPALKILMLSALFTFPGALMANIVLAHNQQKRIITYIALAAASNIFLNILFIPTLGMAGSAIALVISQAINYSLMWQVIQKINAFQILPNLKKILLSTVVMGSICLILNQTGLHVLANIGISIIVYFGLLWLMKEKILSLSKGTFDI